MRDILGIISGGEQGRTASQTAVHHRAEELGIQVPDSYADFVAGGGLNHFGTGCRVFTPEEISAMRRHVRPGFLPFAGTPKAGLFCWMMDGRKEPPVLLFEPHADRCLPVATHFSDWLVQSGY